MTSRLLRTIAVATAVCAAFWATAEEPKCHTPARECERAIRQMLSGRRYLGLDLADNKPGLVVKNIRKESPAARVDFELGDHLIAVNGKSMEKATIKQYKEALAEARQTGRLWIIIERRGAYKKVEARLEPFPPEDIEKVISGHIAQAHNTATAGGQR